LRPTLQLPSVAMQAPPNTVQRSTDAKPRVSISPKSNISQSQILKLSNISQSQILKLQRQAIGNTPGAWDSYERLLHACEPHHFWCWMPDQRLSVFWQTLPAKDQDEITEVESRGFRDLLQEHVGWRTCYSKKWIATSIDVGLLDDGHSISLLQDFFRSAATENACVAVNWQTVEAIDGMIQDSIRADDRVDPNEFPHGSHKWCQHKEQEHTRLALMCMVPEIFERRLLSRWERAHGLTAQRRCQPTNDRKKVAGAESSAARHTRLVVEHLKARAARAADQVINKYAKCVCQPNEGPRTNSDVRRFRTNPGSLSLQLTVC